MPQRGRSRGRSRATQRGKLFVSLGLAGATLAAVGTVGLVSVGDREAVEARGIVLERFVAAAVGGRREPTRGGGCGWSQQRSTRAALGAAYAEARGARAIPPDLVFAFYDHTHNADEVAAALREFGTRRFLGEATATGLLTPDGPLSASDPALGLVVADIGDALVGLGGASVADGSDATEVAHVAFLRAQDDVGSALPSGDPTLVLFRTTDVDVASVRDRLQEVAGEDVPVLGGRSATVGGGALLVNGAKIARGTAVVLFFASEPIGWCESPNAQLTLAVEGMRSQGGGCAGLLHFARSTDAASAASLPSSDLLPADLPWLGIVVPAGAGTRPRSSALLLPAARSRHAATD